MAPSICSSLRHSVPTRTTISHIALFLPAMTLIAWSAVLLLFLSSVASATTGPILAFSFDGTTTSADGGTTLTPQGTGFTYTAGVNDGQAASFPVGGTAYLSSQPLAILPSGNAPRSVAVWVLFQSYSTSTPYINLVSWGSQTCETRKLSSLLFGRDFGFAGWYYDVYTIHTFAPSVWSHVAYTFDGNTLCTYIDGVVSQCSAVCTINADGPLSSLQTDSNTPLLVNYNFPNCWHTSNLVGAVDNLFIYDRALSIAEVVALASLTASPTTSVSASITPSPPGTPTSTPNPSCLPSAYSPYPYSDLSGAVLSVTLGAPSEKDCQLACCGAEQCSGYSWAGMLPNLACFLFANVTGVTPNVLLNSGILVAATPPPTPAASPSQSVPASSSLSPSMAGSVGPRRSPTGTAQGTPNGSPAPSPAQNGLFIRYVRFSYAGITTYLGLQELQVISSAGDNVARGCAVSSSTSAYTGFNGYNTQSTGPLTNTVDGVWDYVSCSNDALVDRMFQPWLEFDLGGSFVLNSINVYVDCNTWNNGDSQWTPGNTLTLLDANRNVLNTIALPNNNMATVYGSPWQNMPMPYVISIASPTPTPTPSLLPIPYCMASLYRALPRTDLVGTLTGNAWYPGASLPATSEAACRQACCDAPVCDAYTFSSGDLQFALSQFSTNPVGECYLYTNVTALVPNSAFSSGALLSSYS